MEPTTGASPHQQAGEQHIRLRHQSNHQHPPALVHQHQVQAALEAHLSQHQRQALVAVQDLERQRLKSLQDSGANPLP